MVSSTNVIKDINPIQATNVIEFHTWEDTDISKYFGTVQCKGLVLPNKLHHRALKWILIFEFFLIMIFFRGLLEKEVILAETS